MTIRRLRAATFAAIFSGIALAPSSRAQPPVAAPVPESWRTLETAHFRIHFRPPAEVLARAVMARVEAARAEVIRLVGHFPERMVDVVIGEPEAVASARGLPFREGPRVLLHAAPPTSARLEDFDDWIAIALGRELAHVAHLSRPPENRALSFLARALPLASLILYLPDWVPEAYAASIGDRLACAATPRRPLHVALLRQLAASGRLPELADLDGDAAWPQVPLDEAVGADFLTWLEARKQGSLAEVWRRMTASAPRTFRGSVTRTFGAPLERLYGEWQRELEARWAEDAEEADSATRAPQGVALDAMSAPHVATDGSIALLLRRRDGQPRLAVLDRAGEVQRFLDLDAADANTEPRWLPDGSVLFVRNVADAGANGEGEMRSDLFRWWPETGRLERLTHGAVLRAADGAADGTWAVAVENRWGASALVRVALEQGAGDREPAALETLVGATADTILDSPRLSPDGRRLAFLRHRGAGWRLVLRDLASGAERELGDPGLRVLAWPAWAPDGRWIVVTVAEGDEVRLEAWSTEVGSGRRRLTIPGAIAMAATFAGSADTEPTLVHLALVGEPQGELLIRQPWPSGTPESWPAAPPAPLAARNSGSSCRTVADATAASRPYGRGPTTYSTLLGGGFSPSAHNIVGGWRGGDVIGRWEAVAINNVAADGAEKGGIVSAVWRGWRYPLQFHGYAVERRPSRQPEEVAGLGESLDLVERGFALESGWRRDAERRTLDLGGALVAHKLTPRGSATVDRYALFLRGDAGWTIDVQPASRLRLGTSFLGASGWTDSAAWRRYGGELRGGFSMAMARRLYALDASWSALVAEDARLVHDRLSLGGTESSLIPPRFDLGRVYEAALPAGTRVGDRWEAQRLMASHEGTPVTVFWARHRLSDEGEDRGDWLRLAGLEVTADRDARPVFRLPSSTVRVGAAYVFDEPFRHRWMVWAGLAWTL